MVRSTWLHTFLPDKCVILTAYLKNYLFLSYVQMLDSADTVVFLGQSI